VVNQLRRNDKFMVEQQDADKGRLALAVTPA